MAARQVPRSEGQRRDQRACARPTASRCRRAPPHRPRTEAAAPRRRRRARSRVVRAREQREAEFDRGAVPRAGRGGRAAEVRLRAEVDHRSRRAGWRRARTYVELEGRDGVPGERSRIPFHVTSGDWQESDRAARRHHDGRSASPTRAVPMGGAGTVRRRDDSARSSVRASKARFTGDRMRALDVEWGRADAQRDDRERATPTSPAPSSRRATRGWTIDGKYAIGFPRKDGGEEINGRIRVTQRPLDRSQARVRPRRPTA